MECYGECVPFGRVRPCVLTRRVSKEPVHDRRRAPSTQIYEPVPSSQVVLTVSDLLPYLHSRRSSILLKLAFSIPQVSSTSRKFLLDLVNDESTVRPLRGRTIRKWYQTITLTILVEIIEDSPQEFWQMSLFRFKIRQKFVLLFKRD